MRIGALVLVGVGFFSFIALTGACTATTSTDLVCQGAGGVCIPAANLTGCAEELQGTPCDTGYVCCAPASTNDAGAGADAATSATTDAATGG